MREIREIKDQLTSQDIEVLEQSLRFANARCTHEAERGKAAENRATAMLAFLGILAGFIVPVIETVEKVQGDAKWTLLIVFLASLLFIVKGLYYAVRVLGVSKVYRLEIGTVFDFQPLSREDALREEIAGLIWEYRKAIQPNTVKHFRLHRSQRSGLVAVVTFMLFGILLIVVRQGWLELPSWSAVAFGAAALAVLVFGDRVFETFGFWKRETKAASSSPGSSDTA